MSQIIGVDHASQIISSLERRMNEKGIVIADTLAVIDGSHVVAMGMGNRKKASVFVPKLSEQPNDEEAASLVSQYLSSIESGLRTAPMPSKEAE